MSSAIENRIKVMLSDIEPDLREEMIHHVLRNPADAFKDQQIFRRALSSLSWYELIQLTGPDLLIKLLDDKTIKGLFPAGRRIYYTHAKRLLSKYTVSASG